MQDIKPSNVFLNGLRVTLGDFGIAVCSAAPVSRCVEHACCDGPGLPCVRMQAPKKVGERWTALVGTPGYVSLDVIQGSTYATARRRPLQALCRRAPTALQLVAGFTSVPCICVCIFSHDAN